MTWKKTSAARLHDTPAVTANGLEHPGPLTLLTHYPGDRFILRYDASLDELDAVGVDGDAPELLKEHESAIRTMIDRLPALFTPGDYRPRPTPSRLGGYENGFYADVTDFRPELDGEERTLIVNYIMPLTNAAGGDTLQDGDLVRTSDYGKADTEFAPVTFSLRINDVRELLGVGLDHTLRNGVTATLPSVAFVPRPGIVARRACLSYLHEVLLWGFFGDRDCEHGFPYAGGDMRRFGVLVVDHLATYPSCFLGVVRSLSGTFADPNPATRAREAD